MANGDYLAPLLVSNGFGAALIFLAFKWPRIARGLFVFVFLTAAVFNAYTALTRPADYLSYGNWAALDLYRDFINGPFAAHTSLFILAIAAGQLCTGALLTQPGRLFTLGIIGGILFFVAIAPLGYGSAFPSTLLMALALFILYRRLAPEIRSPQNS